MPTDPTPDTERERVSRALGAAFYAMAGGKKGDSTAIIRLGTAEELTLADAAIAALRAAPEGEATATTTLPELMKQVFDERTPSGDDRCARCGGEGFTVTEYLRQDEHGRECPEYDRQMCAACEGTGERPPSGDDVEGPWVTREQIGELHDAFTTCLHTNRRCACTFWSDMDPEQQDEFVEMTRKVGIEVRDDVEGR